ncbi:MAG: GtrA family protein [Desulfofustis sp.]|nr:GtrA family protein [Desulfofustis sp.]
MKIVKFFTSSVIATGVDFLLYLALINVISPTAAHALSAATGMVINFTLQYTFVFTPTNTLKKSIGLSLCFAGLGVLLGTAIIYLLTHHTPLADSPVTAKIITVGLIFFYNYVSRKFSFGDSDARRYRQGRSC